jgi:hypothetical protein
MLTTHKTSKWKRMDGQRNSRKKNKQEVLFTGNARKIKKKRKREILGINRKWKCRIKKECKEVT